MDDYRKLSREWGSKTRKEQSRQRKTRLRNLADPDYEPTDEELQQLANDAFVNRHLEYCSDCGAAYEGFHACQFVP